MGGAAFMDAQAPRQLRYTCDKSSSDMGAASILTRTSPFFIALVSILMVSILW
jgi:hypothetical protein